MKAFLIGVTLVVGISISSGCQSQSQANESEDTDSEVLAPEVQIMANKQVEKGQKESISAIVTLGDDFVNEAEVVFEIKRDEDSEKITANFADKGKYVIDYSFESDGQYEVIAHTNAEGYHIMPSVQIQVGDSVTSPQPEEKSETPEHQHHDNAASEE